MNDGEIQDMLLVACLARLYGFPGPICRLRWRSKPGYVEKGKGINQEL